MSYNDRFSNIERELEGIFKAAIAIKEKVDSGPTGVEVCMGTRPTEEGERELDRIPAEQLGTPGEWNNDLLWKELEDYALERGGKEEASQIHETIHGERTLPYSPIYILNSFATRR